MSRDALRELPLTNDRRGEDRVGSGDTCRADQTIKPVHLIMENSPDEETCDEPAEGHDGHQKKSDRSPMLFHIVFGQFNADGEALYYQNYPRELQRDLVDIAPGGRIYQVGCMWSENYAADGGYRSFTNV